MVSEGASRPQSKVIMTYASGSAAILAAAGKMPAFPGALRKPSVSFLLVILSYLSTGSPTPLPHSVHEPS